MTREEAIQWLEAMKSAYALPIETYEAIDMAIEALQTDLVPCKDCRHLLVVNSDNVYAVCQKFGYQFLSFEDDTRTHYCSWGERRKK